MRRHDHEVIHIGATYAKAIYRGMFAFDMVKDVQILTFLTPLNLVFFGFVHTLGSAIHAFASVHPLLCRFSRACSNEN